MTDETLTGLDALNLISESEFQAKIGFPKTALSDSQTKLLCEIFDFVMEFDSDETKDKRIYSVSGYAGSGKSTIINALILSLLKVGGLTHRFDYHLITPTNKAKNVLRQKGHETANTVFSEFFIPLDLSADEEFVISLTLYYCNRLGIDVSNFQERNIIDIINEINSLFNRLNVTDRTAVIHASPSLMNNYFTPGQIKKYFKLGNTAIPVPQNLDITDPSQTSETIMFLFNQPVNVYSIIIIDEASMFDDFIVNTLLEKFPDTPIIQFGDVGQLDPVKNPTNKYLNQPNFTLTENKRIQLVNNQTESNILAYALDIRKKVKYIDSVGSLVLEDFLRLPIEELFQDKELMSFCVHEVDQCIAGKNKTVNVMNDLFRKELGFKGSLPCKGDKLVAKKNNRDLGIFNSDLFKVTEVGDIDKKTGCIYLSLVNLDSGQEKHFVPVNLAYFDPRIKEKVFYKTLLKHAQLNFGYCITCHASQGSEYDNVLVIEEPITNSQKWIYTAWTRPKKFLISLYHER
jgi:exodeoxyribonuclease-5